MKTIKMSLAAVMAATVATTGASANMLEEIISNPQLDIEIRPRYEYVNVDLPSNAATEDNAKALTVRTAIGVKMGLLGVDGLNAQIQGMSVDNFGWITDYNPENSKYQTIADGTQSRITQANISYTYEGLTGIFGRKMVVLDNARFIGNVGWRQMPQTYDLVAAAYNWEGLNLLGAYITQVNRIFNKPGDGPLNEKFSTGSVVLHASYTFMPELTVTAYDYMIQNFADQPGIRATGTFGMDEFKIKYEAEYAAQLDPSFDEKDDPNVAGALGGNNTGVSPADKISQDADYYRIGADVIWNALTAGMYYEMLSAAEKDSNSPTGYKGNSFNTPLATLHAHNGWADVWLVTPNQGLEDLAFKLAYNFGEYGKIMGVYHIFSSDDDVTNAAGTSSSDDLGDEIDVAYNYKITKDLGLLLKAAWYSTGGGAENLGKHDTDKYWVQLDYKFHTGF